MKNDSLISVQKLKVLKKLNGNLSHPNPCPLGNNLLIMGTPVFQGPSKSSDFNSSFSFSRIPLVKAFFDRWVFGRLNAFFQSNAALLISLFFSLSSKNFFSFSHMAAFKNCARALFIPALILQGCQHAQIPQRSIEAEFKKVLPQAAGNASSELRPEISEDIVQIGHERDRALKTSVSKRPRNAELKRPIRFAFTAVPVDMILRRISEYTDLQFFADEELIANSNVTLDLTVTNSTEVYALLDMVGSMLGVEVKWEGKKAIFNRSEGTKKRPIDGYLITPILLSENTSEIILARYGVACTQIATLTLCLGENANLDLTQSFIKAVDNARDLVSYRLVNSDSDLSIISSTLGLNDRLIVQRLAGNQWLLVANDPRHFNLILDVAKSSDAVSCTTYIFEPLHLDISSLFGAVHADTELCKPTIVVGNKIVISGTLEEVSATRSLLNLLDKPKSVARMYALVLSSLDASNLGLELDGFNGTLPPENWFNSLTFSAGLNESSGWRSLEIVTDGISSSNVTQTDRVDGNVVTTDGGTQVSGLEDRTVGLTFNIDGVVTQKGFRGRVDFSDSSLDDDVTRTSSCSAYVSLEIHSLSKVCSYTREDDARKFSIFGGSKSKNADLVEVYVALLAHEIASLETLRKVIK